MNFSDFIHNISFVFIKPDTKLFKKGTRFSEWYLRVMWLMNKCGVSFEYLNTKFPRQLDYALKKSFFKIVRVPRMSTLALGAAINQGVLKMRDGETFVNIGVWNGFTFLSGILNNENKKCVGVDNFSQFNGEEAKLGFLKIFNKLKSSNHHFHEMDYEEYFAKIHTGQIGFYIYDGEHSYENQMRGLKLAEPFFSPNCIILVDDTNLNAPRQATLDFIEQSANKYKIIIDQKTSCNGHPTWWNGVIIFQKI